MVELRNDREVQLVTLKGDIGCAASPSRVQSEEKLVHTTAASSATAVAVVVGIWGEVAGSSHKGSKGSLNT